jgi:adenine-specific DNA methylase
VSWAKSSTDPGLASVRGRPRRRRSALLDVTDRGDIVIDPFLGSGSTLIAAENTGRVCRGVELDPLYVDVIVRRFEVATGISATLVEAGETFQALAVRREREAAELTAEPASP